MPEYDDTNRGALFAAKDRASDRHPTHTGKINVEGREYYLSAWVQEAKSGQKYFSLSVKSKDEQPPSKAPPPAVDSEFDSEIPFAHAWALPLASLLVGAMFAGIAL